MIDNMQTQTDHFRANPAVPVFNAPADAAKPSQVDEILGRLDELQDLVAEELEVYRNASIPVSQEAPSKFKLSVVIPVYNEKETILRVIARIAALPLSTEIIVVDDCSTDGTRELLARLVSIPDLRIYLQSPNQGKGAALRTGFQHCTGDFVLIQDADLEYDPRDIPGLLEPLLLDQADAVYGSRFLGDEPQDKSLIHRLGNAVLTRAANLFNGTDLTDMETCYKVFKREILEDIRIDQERFGFEPEITAKLARRGYRIVERPVSYNSRGYDEGKKIGIKDLFNAFYCIGRYGYCD